MSVLVIGAYGTVGSQVVEGLLSAGIPVRGTSRRPRPGAVPDGVEISRFDAAEPETWPAVLDGVRKVFLYANPDGLAEFARAARAAGVDHIVLLSSAAVVEPAARHSASAKLHAAVETAVRESGLAWTFLRPTTFAGLQLRWAPAIRAGEVLRIPFPRVCTASIHERDIADVAVRALAGAGHEGQAYWLTGPQALAQQEYIDAIGAVLGRSIDVVELAEDDCEPKLSPSFVRTMTELMKAPCVVTSAVEDVTGAPARSFRQWAEDHVKEFS
ncbi:NAD(P)H-binding protein [Amycolatopsis sp. OK19-0408]|uniref:NAD(P)H-binding protein n=1 Tax=Amycolatopsis iheyensis TaxID=2945988 RepID=A0A9X2NJ26_9PSEU|nr:NAD(P)H-binding protein [Amycolatopsis iheyensis]MCR6488742.1 NAD(P)H-binding protein [Amycolatopsis iheyensis]